jgi:hypothetical protein
MLMIQLSTSGVTHISIKPPQYLLFHSFLLIMSTSIIFKWLVKFSGHTTSGTNAPGFVQQTYKQPIVGVYRYTSMKYTTMTKIQDSSSTGMSKLSTDTSPTVRLTTNTMFLQLTHLQLTHLCYIFSSFLLFLYFYMFFLLQ